MKNLILLILAALLGTLIYQGFYNKNLKPRKSDQTLEVVRGKVTGNLTILDQSAFELTSGKDTTKSYYVINRSNTPAPTVGEHLTVQLIRKDLIILNDDSISVYLEIDE